MAKFTYKLYKHVFCDFR